MHRMAVQGTTWAAWRCLGPRVQVVGILCPSRGFWWVTETGSKPVAEPVPAAPELEDEGAVREEVEEEVGGTCLGVARPRMV